MSARDTIRLAADFLLGDHLWYRRRVARARGPGVWHCYERDPFRLDTDIRAGAPVQRWAWRPGGLAWPLGAVIPRVLPEGAGAARLMVVGTEFWESRRRTYVRLRVDLFGRRQIADGDEWRPVSAWRAGYGEEVR